MREILRKIRGDISETEIQSQLHQVADAMQSLREHKDYPMVIEELINAANLVKDEAIQNGTPETLHKYQSMYSALFTLINTLEATHETFGITSE